ncbi:MAG: hypothetical protein PW843_18095 [Azospirillaceae bacterium]|nr:hypothetical protein [Azospirillaceae bacterium]
MIHFSAEAEAQLASLQDYFEERLWLQALEKLADAVDEAERFILNEPAKGLPAPRPYPWLTQADVAWIKVHRYWFAYRAQPPLVLALFDETADIPGRYPRTPD